jgi:histidine triad (HIT) family protein
LEDEKMALTVFERIIAREIPARIVYEDDDVVAFHDISPQAPAHVVVVPKQHLVNLLDAGPDDTLLLGKLLQAATHVARTLGLDRDGYRVVVNVGKNGGQSVDHLHLHVLGGRPLGWPPG